MKTLKKFTQSIMCRLVAVSLMVILLILPVYAENANKQLAANPIQPNQTVQVCGAILIVLVTTGGVVLVMWLNSCLPSAPATPAPTPAQPPPSPAPPPPIFIPPIPPPFFFPPIHKQQSIMQPTAKSNNQTNSSQALIIVTNNSTVYYWSVIDNGWTDWQTNIYVWSFNTTFTNFVPRTGTLDIHGNPMTTAHLESTTDFIQWNREIYSTTGWVSYTSIPDWVSQPVSDWSDYFGCSASKLANVVYIVYDSQGTPLMTNGSCGYTATNNSDGYTTTMTSASGVIIPASPSIPHKFYRLTSP